MFLLKMKKVVQLVFVSDAQEVAELAIVLPILLILIFCIFSFARAYNIYSTITRAAQEGARVATASLCVTCPPAKIPISCAVSTSPGQLPPDQCVAQAVSDALLASHLDPSHAATLASLPEPPCSTQSLGASGEIYICRNVALSSTPPLQACDSPSPALQACDTIVSFHYQYRFLPVPFLTFNQIPIPAWAQVRVEF